MSKRTITGLCIAAALGILIHVQGLALRLFWIICMAVSIWECYEAFSLKGVKPLRWVGLLYALAALPSYLYLGGEGGLVMAMVFCFIIGCGAVLLSGKPDLPRAAATVMPIMYPGFLFALMFPLQDQPEVMMRILSLAMLFAVPLLGDVGAYLVGCRFGKHKLCPAISPHKTVEGAVGGMVSSVLAAILLSHIAARIPDAFPRFEPIHIYVGPVWHYMILGLVGSAFSQFGDLTASMIKRFCGEKDFGNLFPGHGGMLDRFDSVLFMSVVTYAYFIVLRG